MGILRTPEEDARYREYREEGGLKVCRLCQDEDVIKTFKYWKIMKNNFPYDRIAQTHHMIVPLRHVPEEDITPEEWREYHEIKNTMIQDYEFIIEATKSKKSIPGHFHLHLIIVKD
jgi:diadenosine tetraphosphate (Ap4A) HIT family hydrolase